MTELTIRVPEALEDRVADGSLTSADLEDALAQALSTRPVVSSTTKEQRDILVAESGLKGEALDQLRTLADREDEHPVAAAARRTGGNTRMAVTAAVVAKLSSFTTSESGRFVGKDSSTITRWYRDGRLTGFKDARGGLRLPSWQFTERGLLPGMSEIVAHQGSLSLVSFAAIMTTPAESLDGVAPVDWLDAGGDVQPVVAILDGANNW